MAPDRPRTSALDIALTLVIAVGACAIFAAVTVPTMLGVGAWPVLIAGVVLLVAAVIGLGLLHRRRDRPIW